MTQVAVTYEIVKWDIPPEGWLHISIHNSATWSYEDFYRAPRSLYRQGLEGWQWARWSMAGKPTVPVKKETAELLTALVREHETLLRLTDIFELSS